jgi:type II secretory pathway component GspD/PulD (secretin)
MRSCLLSAAVLLALASVARADDKPKPRLVTQMFSVADLVTPVPDFCVTEALQCRPPSAEKPECRKKATVAECGDQLVKVVTGMVRPYSWEATGGSGTAEFYEAGLALVVKNSPDVVAEVRDLLAALRRLQEGSVCTEVRLVKLPAGCCERLKLKTCGDAVLSECDLKALLEALQECPEASVMQFPKVTTFDGQTATVRVGEQRTFVTGVEAVKANGYNPVVPKNTTVDLGETLTLCGRVAAGGKSVTLRANLTHTQLVGDKVQLVPVVTQVTPIFEGGSQGKPVPFTQFLQVPELKTEKIEKTATVPCGGTVVLGCWKETAAAGCPVLSKVPYANQLFKNVGPACECEVVALATVRVIRSEEPAQEPKPQAVARPAAADEPATVIRLRNVAAADAAQAVAKYLDGQPQPLALTFDQASNTLYLSADAAVRQKVLKVIAAMDAPPPQVVIQAMVMEAPAGFLADMGMSDDQPNSPVLTLTARETSMFNGVIREGKRRECLDILSRPQIQVADNQTGFVQVGQKVPYAVNIGSKADGARQAITYEPVGVSMRVTPRINPDGKVLMRVEPTVTTVSPSPVNLGNGNTVPAFNTQTMQTTVLASDGQTVILRGMTRQETNGQKREVVTVLTPHVVRDAPSAVTPSAGTDAVAPPLPRPTAPVSAPAPVPPPSPRR